MKKILSLIMAMLLFSTTVFAAPSANDFKAAIEKSITYADINMEIKTETKNISDEMKDFISKRGLIPNDTSLVYDISYKSAPDASVIQASAISQIVNNKNAALTTTKTEQYFDINFQGNRPYFVQVIKTGDSPIYVLYELSALPEMQPFVLEMKETVLSGKYNSVGAIFGKVKEPQVKNDKYILSLNEAEFKAVFPEFANSVSSIVSTSLPNAGVDADAKFAKFEGIMNNTKIYADKAFEAVLTLDKENNPANLSITINFDTNLYTILKAMQELDPTVSADNLNEKNGTLNLSLIIDIDFENVNKDLMVNFPVFTSTNFYNYTSDLIQQYYMYTLEEGEINIYANNTKVMFDDAEPIMENDRTLVPLRKFLNTIGIKDEDIVYDDGNITITYNTKTVNLNVFDTNASITENGTTTPITLDVSAKMVNDRTLVPLRFLSETFGCEVVFQELDETTSFINVVQKY